MITFISIVVYYYYFFTQLGWVGNVNTVFKLVFFPLLVSRLSTWGDGLARGVAGRGKMGLLQYLLLFCFNSTTSRSFLQFNILL